MNFDYFINHYKEVTKQMQDYYKITPEFRLRLNEIINNRFEELIEKINLAKIFELQSYVCDLESIKNRKKESLSDIEINKIIDNIIEHPKDYNERNYSKHKLYKLRALKLKK